MMQVWVGEGKTAEGWTKADLFADREKCFRAGLHVLRRSMNACKNLAPELRLSVYAGGSCYYQPAQAASRELFDFIRVFRRRPAPQEGPQAVPEPPTPDAALSALATR